MTGAANVSNALPVMVHKKRVAMQQYNLGSPFERIAIDVAGPFPESDSGYKYIVLMMDYCSK